MVLHKGLWLPEVKINKLIKSYINSTVVAGRPPKYKQPPSGKSKSSHMIFWTVELEKGVGVAKEDTRGLVGGGRCNGVRKTSEPFENNGQCAIKTEPWLQLLFQFLLLCYCSVAMVAV